MLARPSIVLLLAVGVVLAQGQEESCKAKLDTDCGAALNPKAKPPCTPVYGAVKQSEVELHKFIKEHIGNSFEYLLQWANFNNYKKDREGFAKLYRKLSDDTWEDGIKLVKYLGKRGVVLNFNNLVAHQVYDGTEDEKYGALPSTELKSTSETEVGSLAKVLDLHKHLAISGNKLHSKSLKRENAHTTEHDVELAHFIEEEFAKKHAQTVRDLAGHSSDLYRLLGEGDKTATDRQNDARGLYVHLFDEYLRKLY